MTKAHSSHLASAYAAEAMTAAIPLKRDPHGRLLLCRPGQQPVPVTPVRAFPLSAADEAISLVGPDGSEYGWIERLENLASATRALLLEELSRQAFTPLITRILRVSSRSTPTQWDIETDRGTTQLSLKAEEDIRRLPDGGLLIADAHGLSFMVRNPTDLDKASRRLLDHFL